MHIFKTQIKNKKNGVTAYASSKNRYFTTLPSVIYSIINQTVKPDRFVLYQDGEHTDLRKNETYECIFNLLSFSGIEWEVVYGKQKGQLLNHQHILENSKTPLLWRVDDDALPEHTALEFLLETINKDEKIGAVAGLVIDPRSLGKVSNVSGKIEDIRYASNVQWMVPQENKIIEVDHLYSSFLYKKEAGKHGYCLELSPVAHREETIFTYEMKRNGWKLLVDTRARTWHFRQSQGGIREYKETNYWQLDEQVFDRKLKEWNIQKNTENKLIILDCGMGDHVVFRNILPDLRKKYKNITLAVCFPEIFEDDKDIRLISIAEGNELCKNFGKNNDDYNIYKFCIDNNWIESLEKAYRKKYL